MRPATVSPYPHERHAARRDRDYVAAMHPAQRRAIVTDVVTDLYPRRRSAGVLAMLVWLTVAALSAGDGVHVGHDELAQRFGVGRRTVTRRLVEWRGLRHLDRKRRGQHGAGVTWFAVPASVVHAVADLARARAKRARPAAITSRDIKRRNTFRSQSANLPHVAALRAAGSGDGLPAGPTDPERQRQRVAVALAGTADDCEHGALPGRCGICRHRQRTTNNAR